jgi:hypothetical protein
MVDRNTKWIRGLTILESAYFLPKFEQAQEFGGGSGTFSAEGKDVVCSKEMNR